MSRVWSAARAGVSTGWKVGEAGVGSLCQQLKMCLQGPMFAGGGEGVSRSGVSAGAVCQQGRVSAGGVCQQEGCVSRSVTQEGGLAMQAVVKSLVSTLSSHQ